MIDIDNWNKVINDSAIRGYEEELKKKDILLREKNKKIERLNKENKRLQLEAQKYYDKMIDQQQMIDKAIKCMGIDETILSSCDVYDVNGIEVYKILKGSDEE